ncbi:hypothetical protein HAZT_HAZT004461 [Hyalella azteca]|uniref:Palmitoyltransferase n=1 Tax=Hyalella azteca TaxID=294128 RepID=A0A6A0H859_HYAAZ|nr:hypothetical protein HAZT_HAZT004461 [Hyalella azteca]
MLRAAQRAFLRRWRDGALFQLRPPARTLKVFMAYLTRLGPISTLVIILLLIHFTYQVSIEPDQTGACLHPGHHTAPHTLHLPVELFGNWLLFLRTKSFIEKCTGNSEISPGLSHSECRHLRYCPSCKIYKPERSHHCSLCDRCIHQRDHHCFFLGTCVGGYNLCYFVIFCFYACIGCFYSANKLHKYYSQTYLRDFWSAQFHYYFYPVTLIHWFYGQAALAEVGWVTLLYIAVATVLFTGFCVTQQLFYVFRGQTAYEYNKGLLMVHRSAAHNFLHVFGRYWMLQLLVPLPRCYRDITNTTILKIV